MEAAGGGAMTGPEQDPIAYVTREQLRAWADEIEKACPCRCFDSRTTKKGYECVDCGALHALASRIRKAAA
jgi:hypothetical protein